jgi:hypothetical protein
MSKLTERARKPFGSKKKLASLTTVSQPVLHYTTIFTLHYTSCSKRCCCCYFPVLCPSRFFTRTLWCGHTSFPWWRKTPGAPPGNFEARAGTWVEPPTFRFLTWKILTLVGLELTAVKGKWFSVGNLNHSATVAPLPLCSKRWKPVPINLPYIWQYNGFLSSHNFT